MVEPCRCVVNAMGDGHFRREWKSPNETRSHITKDRDGAKFEYSTGNKGWYWLEGCVMEYGIICKGMAKSHVEFNEPEALDLVKDIEVYVW